MKICSLDINNLQQCYNKAYRMSDKRVQKCLQTHITAYDGTIDIDNAKHSKLVGCYRTILDLVIQATRMVS